jgi:hypothetical protein
MTCQHCSAEPDALSPCPCAHSPCIHDRNLRIATMDTEMADLQRAVTKLTDNVAKVVEEANVVRESYTKAWGTLAERDRTITDLRAEIDKRDKHLANKGAYIERLTKEASSLRQERIGRLQALGRIEAEHEAVLASRQARIVDLTERLEVHATLALKLETDCQEIHEARAICISDAAAIHAQQMEALRKEHAEALAAAERKAEAVRQEWKKLDAELRHVNAKLKAVRSGPGEVWFWQGAGDDPAAIACPVVMQPETLRALLGAGGLAPEVQKAGTIVWGWATSKDAEQWEGSFVTRAGAVADGLAEASPGQAVFVIRGRYPLPSEHAPKAIRLVEDHMEDSVHDLGGWDDSVFVLRDEKAADEALKAWADAHVAVLAWGVLGKPELVRASDESEPEPEEVTR